MPRAVQQSCHAKSSLLRRQESKISIKMYQSQVRCARGAVNGPFSKLPVNLQCIKSTLKSHPTVIVGCIDMSPQPWHYQIGMSIPDSRNHQIHTRIPYVDDQGPSGRPYRAKGQELRGRTRPREWLRGPQVPYGFAFRVQQPWTRAAKWVIVLRQNWERIWSETV
jgi:hypothetical protein